MSNYDLVVVFGGSYLNKVSNEPGLDTISRLEKARQIWEENQEASLLVSAGLHHPDLEKDRALAQDMKRWLIQMEVPQKVIFTEEESFDTYGGVESALELTKEKDYKEVCMVSNRLHLVRAKFITGYMRRTNSELSLDDVNFYFESSSMSSQVDWFWRELISWGFTVIVSLLPNGRAKKKEWKTKKPPYRHLH